MPIRPEELIFKYSTATSPGNSVPGRADSSLGGYISTTQVPPTLNNVFDDITGAENAADQVDYRCIFLHNANTRNLPLQNAVLWLVNKDAYGAFIALGADPNPPSVIDTRNEPQAVSIPNTTTAPQGVTFSDSANSYDTGINLGTVEAGFCVAFWYRRTARNTSALDRDSVSIQVQGTSLY
jgi:hypothetical protein